MPPRASILALLFGALLCLTTWADGQPDLTFLGADDLSPEQLASLEELKPQDLPSIYLIVTEDGADAARKHQALLVLCQTLNRHRNGIRVDIVAGYENDILFELLNQPAYLESANLRAELALFNKDRLDNFVDRLPDSTKSLMAEHSTGTNDPYWILKRLALPGFVALWLFTLWRFSKRPKNRPERI